MENNGHMTPRQVATLLDVDVRTVRKWIKNGCLRAVNIGLGDRPAWKVARCDLDSFLDERSNQKGTN